MPLLVRHGRRRSLLPLGPRGKAEIVGDTYKVSGRWQWASGSSHCRWLMGGCVITENGKPRTVKREPWPLADAQALWQQVEKAKVFDFKPEKGPPAPDFQKTTMIITEPVRSGRQIYAARGDLIVMGPVSAGAELLADGNIHVYSSLRGRALAGISGDTNARIFCHSLEAELVSIAGLYRVSEDLDASVFKKQVHIYLDDGYLRMDPLS